MAKRSQKVTLTLTDPIDIINEVEQKIRSLDLSYNGDLIDPHKFFMNYRQVMPFGNPAGLKSNKGVRLTAAGWGFMKRLYNNKMIFMELIGLIATATKDAASAKETEEYLKSEQAKKDGKI